jgi:hypothetical protein
MEWNGKKFFEAMMEMESYLLRLMFKIDDGRLNEFLQFTATFIAFVELQTN